MRKLQPGETKNRCKCGTYFIVQPWKHGKEREQCTNCRVTWKAVYQGISEMPDAAPKTEQELQMLFEDVRKYK